MAQFKKERLLVTDEILDLVREAIDHGPSFVSDQLGSSGRRFRCLTIVDNFTRESFAIEVDTSLPGSRVARVLERLAFTRGLPQAIVVVA